MKQHLSVLLLAARSTIYKVIGILVLMAAAESASFYFVLEMAKNGAGYGLEDVVAQSRMAPVCAVFFLLLCAVLSLNGVEFSGGRFRYTMRRLSVGEETAAAWWAVYYMACFFVFWAFQLLTAFLLCRLYAAQIDPAYVSGQTIFLAFCRNGFLHSLLPLEETSRYIRNLILILGLGITASCFCFRTRHDQKGLAMILLAVVAVGAFSGEIGRRFRT
jgi:hypothetical protein